MNSMRDEAVSIIDEMDTAELRRAISLLRGIERKSRKYEEVALEQKNEIDWDEFPPPGSRSWNVEEYMEEMRGNDRI